MQQEPAARCLLRHCGQYAERALLVQRSPFHTP
jgi:hypothetical protein